MLATSIMLSKILTGRLILLTKRFCVFPLRNNLSSNKHNGTFKINAIHPPKMKGVKIPIIYLNVINITSKCCIPTYKKTVKVIINIIFFTLLLLNSMYPPVRFLVFFSLN